MKVWISDFIKVNSFTQLNQNQTTMFETLLCMQKLKILVFGFWWRKCKEEKVHESEESSGRENPFEAAEAFYEEFSRDEEQ